MAGIKCYQIDALYKADNSQTARFSSYTEAGCWMASEKTVDELVNLGLAVKDGKAEWPDRGYWYTITDAGREELDKERVRRGVKPRYVGGKLFAKPVTATSP